MTTTTQPTDPAAAPRTVLPWRAHLRISLLALLSHRMYLICSLLFPLVVLGLDSDAGQVRYRVTAVVVMALFPTGAALNATLSTAELGAFGTGPTDQRRHVFAGAAVSVGLCAVSFAADAVVVALAAGPGWTDLAVAAVAAPVVVALRTMSRLRQVGRDGDAASGTAVSAGPTASAAGLSGAVTVSADRGRAVLRSAVHREWRRVAWAGSFLAPVQMLARVVAPGAVETVMSIAMLAVGIVALTAGTSLSGLLNAVLVFGGRRRDWAVVVLRGALVVPVAGAAGAGVAVVLEALCTRLTGLAAPSPLVTVHGTGDVLLVLVAGAASGVVTVAVGLVSALADQALPVWAQVLGVMVTAAAVVGLLTLIWNPGTGGWTDAGRSAVGPVLVCVVGGAGLPVVFTALARRCSLRPGDGIRGWLGTGS